MIERLGYKLASWFPGTMSALHESRLRRLEDENSHLEESVGRLSLELENQGWARMGETGEHKFSREALRTMIRDCVAMALKNPLTVRSVSVQADYVFGRGVKFVADHPSVQAVIDEHTSYCQNAKALYAHDAMSRQERELTTKGNLFFVLFTNQLTGRVIVRTLDMDEVADIIRDPDDYEQEWFIKRVWTDANDEQQITYYPALGITKRSRAKLPANAEPGEIQWDAPVHHVKFNYFGQMKFGIPEIWSSIDWSLAYKRFLEDWSSIMRSFARLAMKITGAGKKQAAAAKARFQSTASLSSPAEKNPSPVAGAFSIMGKDMDIEPVKTAGATTPAKEGQPLLNMSAAGIGLPNTFFGDASVGNHATATTLDRPTELKMVARQKLWGRIFGVIFEYVIFCSAKAQDGMLAAEGAEVTIVTDLFTNEKIEVLVMPNNDDETLGEVGVPISAKVNIKFPELLERNVTDRVRALTNGLTFFGKAPLDIVPDKRDHVRWLLDALNIEYDDAKIRGYVAMWEKNMNAKDGKPVEAYIVPPPAPEKPGLGAEDPSQGGDVGNNG